MKRIPPVIILSLLVTICQARKITHARFVLNRDIKIAYNNVFDIHAVRGTIKSIGYPPIKYYDVFDIHDPRRKIRSVGGILITFYNDLDTRDNFGLIKSISGNSRQLTVTQHCFNARHPLNNSQS